MKMTKVEKANYEKAKKRYNDLMFSLALEYRTIGTDYSEDTNDMTIEDMANECKYWHDTYYEEGHTNYEFQFENKVKWRSEKDRLWRFHHRYHRFKGNKEG